VVVESTETFNTRQTSSVQKNGSVSVQRAAMLLARKTEAVKTIVHRRRNEVGLNNGTQQMNAHKFGFVRGAAHGLTAGQSSNLEAVDAGKRHATSGHRVNDDYQTQQTLAASSNVRHTKNDASLESGASREYEDPKGVFVAHGETKEKLKLSTIDFGSRGLLAEWRDSGSREPSHRTGSYVQSARQYG
jgi:hypothetical protein